MGLYTRPWALLWVYQYGRSQGVYSTELEDVLSSIMVYILMPYPRGPTYEAELCYVFLIRKESGSILYRAGNAVSIQPDGLYSNAFASWAYIRGRGLYYGCTAVPWCTRPEFRIVRRVASLRLVYCSREGRQIQQKYPETFVH